MSARFTRLTIDQLARKKWPKSRLIRRRMSRRKAPVTITKKATTTMEKTAAKEGQAGASPSQLIDARIAELADWRGEMLARVRTLIKQADPDVVEEWKRGIPLWSHAGLICTGEPYKKAVKLTFAKGAALDDPSGLFNASLEGKVRRAIDIHAGGTIDEGAFKALIRAAVALNSQRSKGPFEARSARTSG